MSFLHFTTNNNTQLSDKELIQYNRHLILPELGMEGQLRLKQARVLVVGAGGLGSPLLQYLTAAGVGTIGIVDGDTVDGSNLHRQVLYTYDDLGKNKASTAKKHLTGLNPNINIKVYPEHLTKENALEIISQYDIIADGTDNFPTRYLVNDACVLAGKINVYASIFRFEGQVAVFNVPLPSGKRSTNYRDLYPTPPPPEAIPNCAESGVLGVLPGIIGSMQANEVIKLITGIGEPLIGKLLLYDAKDCHSQIIQTNKASKVKIDRLIDYELFCNGALDQGIQNISAAEIKELQKQNTDFQLIDVREPQEHAIANIGGELIPLNDLPKAMHRIATDKQVIIYCQTGIRSKKAIHNLQKLMNCDHIYNLEGGMEAWQKDKK